VPDDRLARYRDFLEPHGPREFEEFEDSEDFEEPPPEPVFVDQSGLRGRLLRGLGWPVSLVGAVLAVAMGGSLIGVQADAPPLVIPPQPAQSPAAQAPVSPSPAASPTATESPSPSATSSRTAVRPSGTPSKSTGAKATGSKTTGAKSTAGQPGSTPTGASTKQP
jgi:cytoskeletal protein RodZ